MLVAMFLSVPAVQKSYFGAGGGYRLQYTVSNFEKGNLSSLQRLTLIRLSVCSGSFRDSSELFLE